MSKKPMTATQRKRNERRRKRDLGLVERTVWIRSENVEKLRSIEIELRETSNG